MNRMQPAKGVLARGAFAGLQNGQPGICGGQLIGEVVESLRKELERVRQSAGQDSKLVKEKEKENEDLK